MSCFIKKLTIESISGGIVNFGDSHCISPKNIESSTSGSGGGGNGDFQLVITGKSITNCSDPNKR